MKKIITISLFFLFFTGSLSANEQLPLSAGLAVNKAQLLFQAGKILEAIKTLETFASEKQGLDQKAILKKGCDHYYVHFLLGNYYLTLCHEAGQTKTPDKYLCRAEKCFQHAVTQNSSFAQGWLNLAVCQYEVQAYAKAALAFEKGYKFSETPKPVHLYYAAVCHFQADDAQKALAVYDRLLKTHPDQITLAWKETLVNILFSLDLNKRALPYIEELAYQPDAKKRKRWQEVLLHQYLGLEMKKKALAYANYLTRTDPLEPKWWKALCHIHLDANQMELGLSDLLIYGYLKPMTRDEQKLAADLYMSLDIPVKAADFYEQLLSGLEDPVQDQDKSALKNPGRQWLMLGYAAMNCGQYDRAKQAFEQAVKYEKQKKQAQKALAHIKIIQDRFTINELHPARVSMQ